MITRLAIVGSRDFPRMDAVRKFVRSLEKNIIVVSGGARGVDKVAEDEALMSDLSVRIFPAKWNEDGVYNPRAGFERNVDIVNFADAVVAFWDGESKGTADTIHLAREQEKLLFIWEARHG